MEYFDIQTGEEQPKYNCSINTVKYKHGYLRAFNIRNEYIGYIHDGEFNRVIKSLMTYKDVVNALANKENPIKLSVKKWKLIKEFLLDKNNSYIELEHYHYSSKTCALCYVYLNDNVDEEEVNECEECPLFKSGNGCMTEYETHDVMSVWESFDEYNTIKFADEMITILEELLWNQNEN